MDFSLKKLPGMALASVLALAIPLANCKKDDDDNSALALLALGASGCTLSSLGGDIEQSCTVGGVGQAVDLTESVYIKNGVTLTVLPGTTVRADAGEIIFVEQGGRLVADGTAANPIVFTSSKTAGSREPGDWDGILMIGKAPTSALGGTAQQTEGPTGSTVAYGTDNQPADSSGSLQYVRIEYAGRAFEPAKEYNGLSLYAVGSGTTFNHVQIHMPLDDGMEAWGGTWSGSYIVVTGWGDDAIDIDFGFKGSLNKVLVYSYPHALTTQGIASQDPGAFEVDGAGKAASGHNATLASVFTISNVTAIGQTTASANGLDAIRPRDCVVATFDGGVFLNFPAAYNIRAASGDCSAANPAVTLTDVSIEGAGFTNVGTVTVNGTPTTGVNPAGFITTFYADNGATGDTRPVFVTPNTNTAFDGEGSDWTAGWTNWEDS